MKDLLKSAALAVSLIAMPAFAGGAIDHGLQPILDQADRGETISAIFFLWDQGGIDKLTIALDQARAPRTARNEEVLRTLRDTANLTQRNFIRRLDQLHARGRIARYEPFWLVNAVRVDADAQMIQHLANHPDIKRVHFNMPIESITPVEDGDANNDGRQPLMPTGMGMSVAPGLAAIRAPEAWAMGFTGQTALVATLDTGVSGSHPAVGSRWRGHHPDYQGNPQWAWFDPVTSTTSPQEFASSSHGTHTMGTILGGEPGEAIGVAPGAQWIHAAVVDRVNVQTTVADAIAAFQWIVDPDGDPTTHWDVPHVCSNSWGLTSNHGYPQCDDLLWSFIDNAEAAGVLMVFGAGNEGSTGLRRPADRATDDYRNLAVGAINPHDESYPVASFSSRGPTACTPDGSSAIKPDIAAPGVSIRSAVSGGGYSSKSGTSMAAPHVAGVVALIYDVCPHLAVDDVKQILYDTTLDLGTPGKNNQYGWGLVDALEAVLAAQAACDFVIILPDGVPDLIQPGKPATIAVEVISSGETMLPGSETLHYRTKGGEFYAVPLQQVSEGRYHATLPAMMCGDDPEFFISIEGAQGTIRTHPAQAPDQLHGAQIGVLMDYPVIDVNFADGLPEGWTMTGLWNVTGECAIDGDCPDEQWAYYGIPAQCNYETGFSSNSGFMTTAPITLPEIADDEQITLSFCYTLETEANSLYDRARFRINNQVVKQFDDALEWTTHNHDLSAYAGQTITLRWHFDTVDGLANFYHGWQVDQIRIISPQIVCDDPGLLCPADLIGDGVVDGSDLLILLSDWGACPDLPSPCPADLNGDGVVDGADLLALLAEWGPCP